MDRAVDRKNGVKWEAPQLAPFAIDQLLGAPGSDRRRRRSDERRRDTFPLSLYSRESLWIQYTVGTAKRWPRRSVTGRSIKKDSGG